MRIGSPSGWSWGSSWINADNVFAYGLPYGGVNLSGWGGGVNVAETYFDYLRKQTVALSAPASLVNMERPARSASAWITHHCWRSQHTQGAGGASHQSYATQGDPSRS